MITSYIITLLDRKWLLSQKFCLILDVLGWQNEVRIKIAKKYKSAINFMTDRSL